MSMINSDLGRVHISTPSRIQSEIPEDLCDRSWWFDHRSDLRETNTLISSCLETGFIGQLILNKKARLRRVQAVRPPNCFRVSKTLEFSLDR